MDLQLTWHKPVELKESPVGSDLIYEINLGRIPEEPGVYVFIRKFGKNQNPLYIGKAKKLEIAGKTTPQLRQADEEDSE